MRLEFSREIGCWIYRVPGAGSLSPNAAVKKVVLPMNTRSISFHGRDGLRAVPFFLGVMGPND